MPNRLVLRAACLWPHAQVADVTQADTSDRQTGIGTQIVGHRHEIDTKVGNGMLSDAINMQRKDESQSQA